MSNQTTITYPASKRSNEKSPIFEQMHNSINWFSIQEDDWHLPATKEPHVWCGHWSTVGCLNVKAHENTEAKGKGFVKRFQRSCYRADCETCFKKWLARESNKATRRIEKYEKLSGKNAKHIIISVPSWLYYKPKKELAKQSYKILKDVGCIGGTTIFHPFRKHVVYVNNEIKFEWYYSPHFHVIGFGWIEKTTENYYKNGWVVKNKGFRDSTFATFYYQLSHAGIKKHNHTLVWFGSLSYSKLKVEKEDVERNMCPYCSAKLRHVEPYGLFAIKPPDVEIELLVDLEGWRYVEHKIKPRQPITKEECYEYRINKELFIANKGIC